MYARRLPRLGPARRRRREVRAEGGHHPRAADRWVFRLAPAVALVPYLLALATIPVPGVAVDVPGSRLCSSSRHLGGGAGHPHGRAGPVPTSTPCSVACAPPRSWCRTSCRSSSPWPRSPSRAGSLSLATSPTGGRRGGCCGSFRARRLRRRGVRRAPAPPFDMPVADAELVMGAWTEYTGLRFAFFLLAEYAGIVVMSLLVATLWLGGWHGPFEGLPGLALDPAQGLRGGRGRHLGQGRVAAAAGGPAAAARLGVARAARARPAAADRRRGGDGLVSGLPASSRAWRPRRAPPCGPHPGYPDVAPDLPAAEPGGHRPAREELHLVHALCRECPTGASTSTRTRRPSRRPPRGPRPPAQRARPFAIDFSLCMYCGICIEVCPFDALFWSPQFEYSEVDIRDLLHEKDRLGRWMATVPPPPALDERAAEPQPRSRPPASPRDVAAPMPRTVRPRPAGTVPRPPRPKER